MTPRLSVSSVLLAFVALFVSASASAHESDVVSAREREIAQDLKSAGPTETKGIEAAVVKGTIPLAADFPALAGRVMRAREVTLLPGGVVAVHQHESRPGVAYVLEGELVEHRNDADAPIVRRAGDAAFEKTGVIHWWENKTSGKARVLVVDIVPE